MNNSEILLYAFVLLNISLIGVNFFWRQKRNAFKDFDFKEQRIKIGRNQMEDINDESVMRNKKEWLPQRNHGEFNAFVNGKIKHAKYTKLHSFEVPYKGGL